MIILHFALISYNHYRHSVLVVNRNFHHFSTVIRVQPHNMISGKEQTYLQHIENGRVEFQNPLSLHTNSIPSSLTTAAGTASLPGSAKLS